MAYSYVAYIDESGDDGLGVTFRASGVQGASNWLVISAFIVRQSLDLQCVSCRDEILAALPKKKSRQLHFADLNHAQKLFAAQRVAQKRSRAISILSNKTMIPAGTYVDKNQLYFYVARHLIERISWLCRDHRFHAPAQEREGDGRVRIVFSRRGGMSYPDFKAYLLRLKADKTVQIHWPVVDIEGISAQDHSTRAGLQLADVIASGFAAAVERDNFGNCEWRFAETLKPIAYQRNGNYLSYGVKTLPWLHEMELTPDQKRFADLFKESGGSPGP